MAEEVVAAEIVSDENQGLVFKIAQCSPENFNFWRAWLFATIRPPGTIDMDALRVEVDKLDMDVCKFVVQLLAVSSVLLQASEHLPAAEGRKEAKATGHFVTALALAVTRGKVTVSLLDDDQGRYEVAVPDTNLAPFQIELRLVHGSECAGMVAEVEAAGGSARVVGQVRPSGPSCDFCHSTAPRWRYPVNQTEPYTPAASKSRRPFMPKGAWVACDVCSTMIDLNLHDGLPQRVAACYTKINPGDDYDEVYTVSKDLFEHVFWPCRSGEKFDFEPMTPRI
jgi:hypothetical protein